MISDTIAVLERTAPPPLGKPIFNSRECNAAIHALENRLGLPPSKDHHRIGLLNARLKELQLAAGAAPATPETQLAKSARLAAETRQILAHSATLTAPVAAAANAPAAPVEIAPAVLAACAQAVFGTSAAESYEGQRLQFTRAGLTVPGLQPAPENRHFTPSFTGLSRSVRGDRQEKINAFFTSSPKH
jgi:hypothetical protein